MTSSTLSAPTTPEDGVARAPVGRLLPAAPVGINEHEQRYGAVPVTGHRGALLPTIEAAGLAGRGGAGFPTWRKLAAAAASGPAPVVIANAAEGEPLSSKDKTLLSTVPHLVLDGLQVAADVVGARDAYLYVAPGPAAEAPRAALLVRRTRQRDPVAVTLVEAPDTFIAGQETAVIAAISGNRALPFDAPRRITESGLRGRPTVVNNVETLAHLAQIARYGASWFRRYGTEQDPGTFLATLSGPVARPGVYEVAYGTSVHELFERAGGPTAPLQAVLFGGFHGTWVPSDRAWNTPLSRAGLEPIGASVGAGVILALADSQCGLTESTRIVTYLAEQSAGQCGPCLNGLPRLAETLQRLCRSGQPDALREAGRLVGLVENRGACRHPDGTTRLVRSALSVFADEVSRHLDGRCRMGRAG